MAPVDNPTTPRTAAQQERPGGPLPHSARVHRQIERLAPSPQRRTRGDDAGEGRSGWRWRGVLLALVTAAAAVALVPQRAPAHARAAASVTPCQSGESFVYQFDPDTSSFVFTFTIPTQGAAPWDVAVTSDGTRRNVWFTESGADGIGRLVYTSTSEYDLTEYPLAAGSQPLNLVPGEGYVYFTAEGRSRVGRLDPTTGQIDEFEPPTAESSPAGLDLEPDGSVWFTQMAVDQVAHLVITSSLDYRVTEYWDVSLDGGRPYGVAVAAAGVYLAQTANDRVTLFAPPDDWMHIYSLDLPGVPDEPYALALDGSGEVWGTERAGNRVSHFAYGTIPFVGAHALSPQGSMPTDIAVDAADNLWFTQWMAGQIGHLARGVPPELTYAALPLHGLAPTGIAVDGEGAVWIAALCPYRTYLSFIQRN
jgi:virginiamycin B lyase